MPATRSSYEETRERLRWRVALVLVGLVGALMLVLAPLNTQLGFADTARLSWIVFAVNAVNLAGLLLLPRRLGANAFFGGILALTVFAIAYGWWNERPLQYWGYLFPPVVVFLLPAWRALAAMIVFGAYAIGGTWALLPAIDLVRFASVYGLMVCFVTTYALLEERAAALLRERGERDGLTGCFNRRSFNEAMARWARTAAEHREARPFGLLLIDVDHFKAINDTRGHLEGDHVLEAVAHRLEACIRQERAAGRAELYRYGGEEFAVWVRGDVVHRLERLADALCRAIALGGEGLAPGTVTVSVGGARWQQGREALEAALARADDALYEAKRRGRNCVVIAEVRSPSGMETMH